MKQNKLYKIIILTITAVIIMTASFNGKVYANEIMKLASSSSTNTTENIEDLNNYIKSLTVKGYEIYPEFNRNTTEYFLSIPTDVEELDVKAETEAEDSTVRISGEDDLSLGANEITITVTSKSKKTKKYIINAIMTEDDGPKLKSLEVEGATLTPEFSESKYLYKTSLEQIKVDKLEALKINAVPNNESATIEILGNDNLTEGENIITILVKYDDEMTTYQIIADISSKVAVTSEEGVDNFFVTTFNKAKEWIQKILDTEQKRISAIVAGGVVLFAIIVIIIISKHKKRKARKNKEQIKKRVR